MKQVHKSRLAIGMTLMIFGFWFSGFSEYIASKFLPQPETRTFNSNDFIANRIQEIKLNHIYKVPYVVLSAIYDMAPMKDYPNLFQTADANAGIRMEFSGTSNAIIYATAGKKNYNALAFPELGVGEKRYRINISAMNEGFFKASFDDGKDFHQFEGGAPNFSLSKILVGQGFNSERKFTGTLQEFKFSVVEYHSYQLIMRSLYALFGLLYLVGLGVLKIIPTRD